MSRLEELRTLLAGIADDLYADQLAAIAEQLAKTARDLTEALTGTANHHAQAADRAAAMAADRATKCARATAEAAADLRTYAEHL
ncbi:hypothetical protein ABT337_28415 [Saccharopolyspora hirsuta]|uniref:hypothetical protein n=1 Tax=Saccharopolyspora hirsuta TaxID=1837 RepID=UPI003327D6B8